MTTSPKNKRGNILRELMEMKERKVKTIQKIWRGILFRKKIKKLKAENELIHKNINNVKKTKLTGSPYNKSKLSIKFRQYPINIIKTIQSFWRGFTSRRNYNTICNKNVLHTKFMEFYENFLLKLKQRKLKELVLRIKKSKGKKKKKPKISFNDRVLMHLLNNANNTNNIINSVKNTNIPFKKDIIVNNNINNQGNNDIDSKFNSTSNLHALNTISKQNFNSPKSRKQSGKSKPVSRLRKIKPSDFPTKKSASA